eukprot:1053937_1
MALVRCKSYVKIFIIGVIASAGVSGIYSYLNNVQSIEVWPSYESDVNLNPLKGNSHVYNGIYCSQALGDDGYADKNASYCNALAKTMANTANVTEWDCLSQTDYTDKSLYDDIPIMRGLFIAILVSSLLYGICAISHDCRLIYYYSRNKLDELGFHFADNDFYYTSKLFRLALMRIWDPLIKRDSNIYLKCVSILFVAILCIVCSPLLLLWFIIFMLELLFSFYVTSLLIGFCRTVLIICSVMMIWSGVSASKKIHSLDDANCACNCAYMLHQTDFFGFAFTTLGIMASNMLFIKPWRK